DGAGKQLLRDMVDTLQNTEHRLAAGADIHAAVGVHLYKLLDLHQGTEIVVRAILDHRRQAERLLFVEALADHLLIARLENVQVEGLARKHDDLERKEGNEIDHSSRTRDEFR